MHRLCSVFSSSISSLVIDSLVVRYPMSLVSVDATNYYDQVNHLIMILVWLLLINQMRPIAVTLSCLQTTSFHQQIGYDKSSSFFGGPGLPWPFCGLGQGNATTPVSWIQLSSIFVNIFRGLDFGANVLDPIT